MTGRPLKWHESNKHELAAFNNINVKLIPIDAAFWRAWKTDQKTMRAAGVKLRKINGQWQAWMEHRI